MTSILGFSITILALALSQKAAASNTPTRGFNRETHDVSVFTQIRQLGVRIPQPPQEKFNIRGLGEAVNTPDISISRRRHNGISHNQGLTAGYIGGNPEGDSSDGRAQTVGVWSPRFESWSPCIRSRAYEKGISARTTHSGGDPTS